MLLNYQSSEMETYMGFVSVICALLSTFKKPICIVQLESALGFIHSFPVKAVLNVIVLVRLLSFRAAALAFSVLFLRECVLPHHIHVLHEPKDHVLSTPILSPSPSKLSIPIEPFPILYFS